MPLDTIIGVDLPWLDYKWGYTVRMPVKNPAISDAIVQYFPWRNLVMNIWKEGQIPLWNPYAFSGTPLAANWQSAPFYPLNTLMFLFGNNWGWSLIIMLQPILSLTFTFLLLREFGLSKNSSLIGSIVSSFSGFMMIFLEYNSPAQAAIWLPLALLIIQKYIKNDKTVILLPILSLTIFTLLTAGNFQVSAFTLLILFFFIIYKVFVSKESRVKDGIYLLVFISLGVGLSAIQLIPTFELLTLSFRNLDSNISQYNYGLVPLKNIVTFLAPDFFGNPVTGNSRTLMYHETTGYFSILALPFIISTFFGKKKKPEVKFFSIVFIISLLLLFDTPIGKLIYTLRVPFFSTSYASRILFLTDFSAAILTAYGFEKITREHKTVIKISGVICAVALIILTFLFCLTKIPDLSRTFRITSKTIEGLNISFRNFILPSALITLLFLGVKYIKNKTKLSLLVIPLVIFDLFRFGLKYNTFSPANLIYPTTPTIDFLKNNIGYYRMDKEHTSLMPPNTWIPYGIQSPSGYDPLYSKTYSEFYDLYNGYKPGSSYTRYAELTNYDSRFLDLAGVKYLAVVLRDDKGVLVDTGGNSISYKIPHDKFKKVFQDNRTIILENVSVMPRVVLFDKYDVIDNSKTALEELYNNYDFRNRVILNKAPEFGDFKKEITDTIKIEEYSANKVVIESNTKNNSIVFLSDTYYPGWKVFVDGNEEKILKADGVYRAVPVLSGTHIIEFKYMPQSFSIGFAISLVSFLCISIILTIWYIQEKKFNQLSW